MSLDEWVEATGTSSLGITLADGRHIYLDSELLAAMRAPKFNRGHPMLARLDPETKTNDEPIIVELKVDSKRVPRDVLEGRVRCHFPEKEFGFVGDERQEYYFRTSSIAAGQEVFSGTNVSYEVFERRNGLIAVNINPSFSPKPRANMGIVHSISDRFGTIIGDDGTIYRISRFDASELYHRLKHGMKVTFNPEKGEKGLEAKAIVIVHGTIPTYFGFVRYSWDERSEIVDAVDRREYRTAQKLARVQRVSFQLDGSTPFNIQQVDSFPFGKYVGVVLTYNDGKAWGHIVSKDVRGKLFFHREDITLKSHDDYNPKVSQGERIRFDVVGDKMDARASRVVPLGIEAEEYIRKNLTGTVVSYTPGGYREEARGLIKITGSYEIVPFNEVSFGDDSHSYIWSRPQVNPGETVRFDEIRAGRHANAINVRIMR